MVSNAQRFGNSKRILEAPAGPQDSPKPLLGPINLSGESRLASSSSRKLLEISSAFDLLRKPRGSQTRYLLVSENIARVGHACDCSCTVKAFLPQHCPLISTG